MHSYEKHNSKKMDSHSHVDGWGPIMRTVVVIVCLVLGGLLLPLVTSALGDEDVKGASVCLPSPGNAATWLSNCEQAANSGDGRSAIIIGEIYWNGDGVPKDNVVAAHWWKIADQQGRPDAAYLLGNEAYVRALLPPGNGKVDFAALDEAAHWFQKAVEIEPNSATRAQAQERLSEIDHLHKLMPRT
jgi:hypothetical protein